MKPSTSWKPTTANLQVHPGGTQYALLVEAQQEADECRRPEAGACGDVQAAAGVRGEVQTRESVYVDSYVLYVYQTSRLAANRC